MKSYSFHHLSLFVLLVTFLLSSLLSGPAVAANNYPLPHVPHLVVEGRGVIEETPDTVTVRFEINATAKDLATAKQQVDVIVSNAIKAAKSQRIKDDNINASKIQAFPQYEWQQQTRVYKGERVSRQVSVTLTDSDRYNDLVEALLKAGINRLQSVEMDFSKRKKLEKDALNLALDDAKEQAIAISNRSGAVMTAIYQIVAIEPEHGIQPMMEMTAARSQTDAGGLKLGKQKIEKRVRVVYLLDTTIK